MSKHTVVLFFLTIAATALTACSGTKELPPVVPGEHVASPDYRIGPGDQMQIFVWRNQELSTTVPVRPDGKISLPLIEDMTAAGKTPTELARDIENRLSDFFQEPLVTVMVAGFLGTFDQQVRVIGEAQQPRALPYRADMTLLDVMISVGGLTPFAAGNRATLVRVVDGKQKEYRVRLDDLVREGDIGANAAVMPGDVLIIPKSFL